MQQVRVISSKFSAGRATPAEMAWHAQATRGPVNAAAIQVQQTAGIGISPASSGVGMLAVSSDLTLAMHAQNL